MISFKEKYAFHLDTNTPMTLNESKIQLKSDDIIHLPPILLACSTEDWLTELILSDMRLKPEHCKLLSSCLKSNNSIISLDCSGNFMQAECCIYFGEFMAINSTLQYFILELNNLGLYENEFELFCCGLSKNKGIKYLDLRNNQISSKGGSVLAKSLFINTTLSYLDLRWNALGSQSSPHFIQLTNRNKWLLDCKLEGNNIPSLDIQHIYKNLDCNRLHKLNHSSYTNKIIETPVIIETLPYTPASTTTTKELEKVTSELSKLKDEKLNQNKSILELTKRLNNEIKSHDDKTRQLKKEFDAQRHEMEHQLLLLSREKATVELDAERLSMKCTMYIDELKALKAISIPHLPTFEQPQVDYKIQNNLEKENAQLRLEIQQLKSNMSNDTKTKRYEEEKLIEMQKEVGSIKLDYLSLKNKYKMNMKDSNRIIIENKAFKLTVDQQNETIQSLKSKLNKLSLKLKSLEENSNKSQLDRQKLINILGHIKTEVNQYDKHNS